MQTYTLDGPMSFAEVKRAERTAIDTEAPLWNADTPHRMSAVRAREAVAQSATSIAARDGWRGPDAWAIGNSTATLTIPYVNPDQPLTTQDTQRAREDLRAYTLDPLPCVWAGYTILVRSGWTPDPDVVSKPRFGAIPRIWDQDLPAWVAAKLR